MTHIVTVTHPKKNILGCLLFLIIHYRISVAVVDAAQSNLNADILDSSYDVVDKAIEGGQHMYIT